MANSNNIVSSGIVTTNGTGTFSGRNITTGSGITITNADGLSGNPLLGIDNSVVVQTITGDSGGHISPNGGNITISGGTNVTTSCSGNTLTISSTLPFVRLTTINVSSAQATVPFNSVITNAYNFFHLFWFGVICDNGGDQDLYIQVSNDNGNTYLSSGYTALSTWQGSAAGTNTFTDKFKVGLIHTSQVSGNALFSGFATGNNCALTGSEYVEAAGFQYNYFNSGTGPTNVNAFKFYSQAGNITSGTFLLYGIN